MEERELCVCAQAHAPWLEAALLFTIFAHAAGMVSMVALLLPGMPGGTNPEIAARAAYIADHPWLWRLGWFPWQVTALSNLLLGIALLRTPWVPRLPAIIAVLAVAAAIVPDQAAQISWTWNGIAHAAEAALAADFALYSRYEARVFFLSAGWGAAGYIAGALAWTWCFAAAGTWSRRLTWLSVATWGLFAAATAVAFSPEHLRNSPPVAAAVSLGNAAAFVLLMLWFVGVTEAVLRRSRPDAHVGSRARWRHPSPRALARPLDLIANSRFAGSVGRLCPASGLVSDITDVVYVNYLVEAGALRRFVPHPLELQRLGPDARYALFTFLIFRHGHVAPGFLGPLRRLCPSPIQSNWRIYVHNPRTGRLGVQFLSTAISSTPHALATGILIEGVPMHVPAAAELRRDTSGTMHAALDPGAGSAPDVRAAFSPAPEPLWEPPWSLCFASWREMLSYCVPQDRALTTQPWRNRVIRQEITLNIPLESCQPLAGTVLSNAARAIAGDARPLSFAVARVKFRLLGQQTDR